MVEICLFISLFFPRLGLFIAYLSNSILPNSIPLFGEVVMTIFLPRILIMIYIIINIGILSNAHIWLIIHFISFLISCIPEEK